MYGKKIPGRSAFMKKKDSGSSAVSISLYQPTIAIRITGCYWSSDLSNLISSLLTTLFMNLLFRAKYKYKLNESPSQVKEELISLFSTPWHKSAPRLSGCFLTEYSFRIQPALSRAAAFFGILQSFSVLEGRLNTEDDRTVIRLNARPSHLSLFIFYGLLILTIAATYKAQANMSPEPFLTAIALTALLISYYLILRYSRDSLRRFFQRQMGIKSK